MSFISCAEIHTPIQDGHSFFAWFDHSLPSFYSRILPTFPLSVHLAIKEGLRYSNRNGMGPVPTYVSDPPARPPCEGFDPRMYVRAKELRDLLDELTPVEEAAIRQIAPLMHLTRISHGSMKVKGNTSCVWQQSKLHLVLPNLPSHINFIFIVRSNGSSAASLKSTRARRNHIQRALELLRLCDANGVWSHITINREHLRQWPEDADVSTLPGSLVVHEVDEDGNFVADSHTDSTRFSSRQVPGNQDRQQCRMMLMLSMNTSP